jgi:hypothetical protein
MLWFDAYIQIIPEVTTQVIAPLFDMSLGIILWILGRGNQVRNSFLHSISILSRHLIASLVVIATLFRNQMDI